MVNTNYAIGGLLSAKFGETSTTALHAVGTRTLGNGGSLWIYVQASAAITQYDCLRITEGFKATGVTIDTAKQALHIGFAQVAFAADEYGWAMMSGNPLVRLAADCEPSLALYATATAGILDDATVSSMLAGVVATTSVTGAVTAATCTANFPTVVRAVVLGAV